MLRTIDAHARAYGPRGYATTEGVSFGSIGRAVAGAREGALCMVVDLTGLRPRTIRTVEITAAAPVVARGYLLLIDRANPLSSLRPSSMGWRQ